MGPLPLGPIAAAAWALSTRFIVEQEEYHLSNSHLGQGIPIVALSGSHPGEGGHKGHVIMVEDIGGGLGVT